MPDQVLLIFTVGLVILALNSAAQDEVVAKRALGGYRKAEIKGLRQRLREAQRETDGSDGEGW